MNFTNISLMLRCTACIAALLFCGGGHIAAKTWLVGAGRQYAAPGAVSSLVADGDTVLIDAGEYVGDVCSWWAHNLLLRGVGGRARLAAGGKAAEQKAIWVIKGNNATVENIEFSDCKVPDNNGAGIREEGTNLTVRSCVFRRNEMGILAGNNLQSTIIVEYSEFDRSGYGDGYSHNIYINHIYRFVFRYNYSHHAFIGHECKSRAHRNEILYNRLSNEDGQASREIDLPNGGFSIVMGNVIHQGLNAENSNIIGYGMEGLSDSLQNELYVVNNTIVNERPAGSFVQAGAGTSRVVLRNNVFAGAGSVFNGAASTLDSANNVRCATTAAAGFADAAKYDYHLTNLSPAVSAAAAAGMAGAFSLIPTEEYVHPASKRDLSPPLGVKYSAGAYQFMPTSDAGETASENICKIEAHTDGTLRISAEGRFAYRVWDITGRPLASGAGAGEEIVAAGRGIMFVEVRYVRGIFRGAVAVF